MKNFLIELFRPLDNFLFNYFVKIGVIKPIVGALIGGALSARSASKARRQQAESEARSRADIQRAFEQIRDPRDILMQSYGAEGYYSPEVMDIILGRERELMGPLLGLQRDYAQEAAFGEGGLQELAEQTTEGVLSRMQGLGPEFRKAMEDPRVSSLVDEQLAKFKQTYADTEATSAEREAAAREFDAGLKGALQQVGVSSQTIQDIDIQGIPEAQIGSAQSFLERAKTFGEGGFLGDLRGLTDVEKAEAERLTEAARGPLGFESLRRAEQAARAEGGALGRQLDASAIARAALGREEAVMAREDRAAAARARAAELAGLGSKLDLSALGLGAEIGMGLDKLGLAQEEARLAKQKLALGQQELAGTQAMQLAQLQGTLAAQARQEALGAREEGRAGFRDILTAAEKASVDPSQIFFQEAQPAFDLYSSIIGGTPGTIFTDPGAMINLGSATDVQKANILGGQAAIAAQQAAGAGARAASAYNTAGQLFGNINFSQMSNPFASSGGGTVNPSSFSYNTNVMSPDFGMSTSTSTPFGGFTFNP